MKITHETKIRATAFIMAVLLLLSTSAPAMAETFSAIVTSASMTVYKDSSLKQVAYELEKDDVVRVTSYSGKTAKITYSGKTGYAKIADMQAVDDVASKAVTNAAATVYQTPSTSAKSSNVKKGTRVYVLAWTDEWAEVEKNGVVGYMKMSQLTPTNDDWKTDVDDTKDDTTPSPSPTIVPEKGVVTSKTLTVYKRSNSSSAKLGTLKKGQKVNVIAWDSKWAYIELNGKYGFCKISGLKKDSTQAVTPSPTPTAKPTPTATPATIVTVSTSKLPVYKKASTSANKLGTLKKGQTVTLLAQDGKWAYIELDGRKGYCAASGLSAKPAATASSSPTPSTKPTLSAAVKATVIEESVPVYRQAGGSTSIGSLMWGETVNVLSTSDGWAYIEKSGKYGYCKASALTKVEADPDEIPSGYKKASFSATVVDPDAMSYETESTTSESEELSLGATIDVTAYSPTKDWVSAIVDGRRAFVPVKYLSKSQYDTVASTGTAMQTLLKALLSYGYYDGLPTSTPDSATATAAIKRFQDACGLEQTGKADQTLQRILYAGHAPTSPLLSETLSRGDKGENVTRIQLRLYALGYLSQASSLDGDYGTTTAAAIALFQKATGITTSGTADPATLKKLYSTTAASKPSGVKAADATSSSSGGSVVSPSGTVKLSSTYVTTMPSALKSNTTSFSSSLSNAKKLEYVIYVAQSNLGKPYVYGATGTSSFDCSGLTQYSFKKANINLKRTAYSQGYDTTYTKISSIDSLKRGDLIFFNTISDSDMCDHVGIYLGGKCFIHASSGGHKVVVSSVESGYYNRVFSWGRRVLK